MFEMSGFLPLVNTLAQRYVEPILHDGVLRNDPLPAMLKRKCLKPYRGGISWQQNATYDLLDVLDVAKSNVSYPTSTNTHQVETGYQFDIRSKLVPLSVDLAQLSTDLWGTNVNLDYLETRLQLAALSMSAKIATDCYRDGTQAGRTLAMNGLDEALNDGSTNGWQGVTFANYGTVARSAVNGATSSPMTGPTANFAGGSLTLTSVEDAWASVWYGDEKPDYMLTTIKGFSILKRVIYNPAIRLEQAPDQEFGFLSYVYNGTPVHASHYAPGSRTASAADTKIGYSAITGETLWFLNSKHINFHVSTNPMRSFALWPFQLIPGTQQAVAQYIADVNLTVTPGSNRFMRYLFGFTD
jgi:hypothetical protein